MSRGYSAVAADSGAIDPLATPAMPLPLYRYGVGPTFTGTLSNGRKYPGALTATAAAAD
jgi:hypothetical protein